MKKKLSAFVSLIMSLQLVMSVIAFPARAEVTDAPLYTEPESPSEVYNMNLDWKYFKPSVSFPLKKSMASAEKDGKAFYEMNYDDSNWETVSIPHQVNASDSFTTLGSNQGDTGQYRGVVFYRKHFTVPADAAGKKLFVEFEGIYNTAYVWVNGQKVGYYEATVAPFGFDITKYVTAGQEAVIAVANDSTCGRGMEEFYSETIPGTEWGSNNGTAYQWASHEFMTTQAGLVYNVNLYIKNPIYQTLALYDNMKTTGTYIWADNFDIAEKTATIHVKSEVRNETAADEKLTLQVDVVKNIDPNEDNPDAEEHIKQPYLQYSFTGTGTAKAATDAGVTFETVVKPEVYDDNHVHENTTDVETVDVSYISASFDASDLDFWSTEAPHLYDVYTILKNEAGEIIDSQKITTGFRKVEYSINDGLTINDKSVWLTGYAQRSANEWAAIGSANDWLTDYDMSLVKESNSNFIRWMHNAPRANTVRATDKYGIAIVAPAGDKEADASGRQWSQRVEAMRSVMIRFRNSPSVIFWEAGNNAITAEHQQEMTGLKAKIDPDGGRYCGCRTLTSEQQVTAAKYVGTMLNRHADGAFASMKSLNKFMPIVETEYHREEGARRVWDDYSPPDYDLDNLYKSDAATAGYHFYYFTSEELAVKDAECYQEFYNDRVNGSSGNNYYTAAAALCWTDSNQHARTTYTENGRMSGRTDAVRIPKESFYTYQVMQQDDVDDETQIHIIGHWNYEPVDDKSREEGGNYYYPIKEQQNGVWVKTGEWGRRDPTKKTVYVAGSQYVSKVELLIDGEAAGTCTKPTNTFIYAFPNIDVTQGDKVEAIAYDVRDKEIGRDEIKRTGDAATVRLTPHTGPEGLLADGSDLMYFDVEVVDADGNVCPLSYDKINFTLTGDAEFLGGYNSGYAVNKKEGWGKGETVIGKSYVYAECGVNRVFIRAGRTAGQITLKAEMEGGSVLPVTVTVNSAEYPDEITGGLTKHRQQELDYGT
ncbi:MAG: sugar-binding domain-containing protein, partial [Candidatus Ornithomonoglobus sp.]